MSSPKRSIHEGFHQEQYSIANTGLLSTQPDPLRDIDDDSDLSSPRPVTRSRQLEAAYELIPVTDDDSDHNLQNENDMEYDDDGFLPGTYTTGLGYDGHRSDTTEQAREAHEEHVSNPQTPKAKKKRKAREFDPEIVVRDSFEPESEHATDNLEQPKKKRKRPDTTANLENSNVQVPQRLRRSPRVPYAPLEWWRNEKVEYGGRDPNGEKILVPRIRAIIRIPKVPIVPRKRSRRQRAADDKLEENMVRKKKIVLLPNNPEAGWDDDTQTTATVKVVSPEPDVQSKRIAFTARMYDPQFPVGSSGWSFSRVFVDSGFVAAGQIVIERHARKPVKSVKQNTSIFLVIEGAVNVKIHETSFIVTSGSSFMVPRGNRYFIENIADRPSKLFFTQARQMPIDETKSLSPQVQRSASHRLSLAKARDLQRVTAPF